MIKELNKKLQEKAVEYRTRWGMAGKDCSPVDLKSAMEHGDAMYRACGIPPPEYYVVADSPLSGAILGELLTAQAWDNQAKPLTLEHKLALSRIDDLIRSKARDEMTGPIAAGVGVQARDAAKKLINEPLQEEIRVRIFQFQINYLRSLDLKSGITDSVLDSVERSMAKLPMRSTAGVRKWLKTFGFTTDALKEHINCMLPWSQESGYYGWQEFMFNELGVKSTGPMKSCIEFAKTGGWFAPYLEFIVLQNRQSELHFDDRGRLHNEAGMAVKYSDGFGVWAINGVPVNEKIVMHPDSITVSEIKTQSNAEIRRIMRERFGEGRYLQETGAKVIHADFEGARKGSAPRALMQDHENQRWLVGTDGSTGRCYYMRVPQEVTTCKEAHQALCGFDEAKILAKS